MNVRYCENCGNKHSYTIDIPKFCNSCGKALFVGAVAAQTELMPKMSTSKINISRQTAHIDESEDDDREVPQISQIQIEIEVEKAPKIQFGQAKQSMSFARERQTTQLSIKDLEARLDTSFERDRQTKD